MVISDHAIMGFAIVSEITLWITEMCYIHEQKPISQRLAKGWESHHFTITNVAMKFWQVCHRQIFISFVCLFACVQQDTVRTVWQIIAKLGPNMYRCCRNKHIVLQDQSPKNQVTRTSSGPNTEIAITQDSNSVLAYVFRYRLDNAVRRGRSLLSAAVHSKDYALVLHFIRIRFAGS